MMNFDFEELSIKQIDRKIDDLNNDLLVEGSELNIIYSLDYFSSKNTLERKRVLEVFGLGDKVDTLNLYIQLLPFFENENFMSYLSETAISIKKDADDLIIILNRTVDNLKS